MHIKNVQAMFSKQSIIYYKAIFNGLYSKSIYTHINNKIKIHSTEGCETMPTKKPIDKSKSAKEMNETE